MSGMLPPRSRDEHISFSRATSGCDIEAELDVRPSPLSRVSPGLARISPGLARLSLRLQQPQSRPSMPPQGHPPRHSSKFQSLDLRAAYNVRERAARHNNGLNARRERYLREFNHYCLAIIIGLLLGILGVAFHLAYANLAKLRFSAYFTYAEQGEFGFAYLVNSAISLSYIIIPCGSVLLYPTLAGSGIPGILAFLNGINIPTLLTLPAFMLKFVGSVFSVASGLALGPEGPAIHYGGAFGSLFCKFWYKVVDQRIRRGGEPGIPVGNRQMHFERRRQHFTAMGAAASVAALFRAPIAGTMFVIEEAANHVAVRDVWATFVACVTATATVYSVEAALGATGTFIFRIALEESCEGYTYFEYIFFALVGVLCGCFGSFFNFLQRRLNKLRAKYMNHSRAARACELFAIVLATSAVTVFLPMAFPCEENSAQALFERTSGCLKKPILATAVHASLHEHQDGHQKISHILEPAMFGLQYSKNCIYAFDYDTCRSSTGVPFQNCTIPQRPFHESACYLPGIDAQTNSVPESALDYCCGFDDLTYFKEWVDSNGTGGFIYGHRAGDTFVVTEPYLHMPNLDEASHNGEYFCKAPQPGEAPLYNPAALLMTTPLGSDVANVLFTQGLPSLIPAQTLAAYFIVYFCLACITSGAAVPGGLIVPFVVCGGLLGRLSALCFEWLQSHHGPSALPEWLNSAWDPLVLYMETSHYRNPAGYRGFDVFPSVPDPGTYAIVGAASFMAATGRLSMFFTVLMLEATGYISYSLPISIGAIVATWTGNCFNHGLYHILIEIAKLPYLPTEASVDQEAMQVKDLFDVGYICHVVQPDSDIYKWKTLLQETTHNGFPVVDMHGSLKGLILRKPLEHFIDDHLKMLHMRKVDECSVWHHVYKKIEKEMDLAPVVVYDSDPVDQALRIFSRMRLRHMVVLRHGCDKPVFLLTRHDLHPHAVSHGMAVMKEEKSYLSSSEGEGMDDGPSFTHATEEIISCCRPGNSPFVGNAAISIELVPEESGTPSRPSDDQDHDHVDMQGVQQEKRSSTQAECYSSCDNGSQRPHRLSEVTIPEEAELDLQSRSMDIMAAETKQSEPTDGRGVSRGATWEAAIRRAFPRRPSLKFLY